MTISTHHHFRNGDLVAVPLFDAVAELGVKDVRWFPSASFPCHAPIIKHLDSGVVRWIEGSMNGPLGDYCSHGKMRGTAVLRSHGGRFQAIQDGEVHVDVAVIAAPEADAFGNANGLHGPSACGSLGFALADSMYADKVIVVTDNLVPFPCIPWHIQGNNVDFVVEVPSIGDPAKIVSGTTEITKSPDRLLISEYVARFLRETGIMRNGFSFQAGAGGIALAFVNMPERDVSRAQFDEVKYRAYLDLVRSTIGPRPFIEMRDFLRTDEFHDREHSLPAGSLRLTDAIIDRLQPAILAASPQQRSRRQGCLDRG